MKFFLCKHNNHFLPATDDDEKKASKIGAGEIIKVTCTNQRNVRFHRKFFALIKIAWDNLPEKFDGYFGTPEDLRRELIILAGFYKEHKDFYGNVIKTPESMAFDKMDQEKFEQLYDKVLDLVCRLIGVERNDIVEQIIQEFG